MAVLFIIGRILLGGFFLYNAWGHFRNLAGNTAYAQSKGVPSPRAAVIGTGIMLALAGLSILTGFYLVLGLWLAVLFLLLASFTMHRFWKEADPTMRSMELIQFSKNLALAGAILMLSAVVAVLG